MTRFLGEVNTLILQVCSWRGKELRDRLAIGSKSHVSNSGDY